jgi:multiple sugar transport system permease protein
MIRKRSDGRFGHGVDRVRPDERFHVLDIAVQGIFSFVQSWNNYFVPSLILKSSDHKTLPLLIAQLRNADFLKFDMGQVYMLITIAIVPVIIVYLLLSKFIIRGITLGSVKG